MLNIPSSTKIYVCTQPVDMRFSFDALSGLVNTHFGMNPTSGHLFVFFSKKRDRMKVLSWDLDGFLLYYKRLGATCKGARMNGSKLPRDALLPILA